MCTTSNRIFNWFERSFEQSVNQSPVSRILRKFEENPNLLVVVETTRGSNRRNREGVHPELECVLLGYCCNVKKMVR